jgi:UDP-sugar pyrophosphorylase
MYAQQVLALQSLSRSAAAQPKPRANIFVPFIIMTSDDTHMQTQELLRQNSFFGLRREQVVLIKQEKVAAFLDNDAHLALEAGDPYTIETKPHGHGDVHSLLASTGLARRWRDEGRTHIIFFQDTNAPCFSVVPTALGIVVSVSGWCVQKTFKPIINLTHLNPPHES